MVGVGAGRSEQIGEYLPIETIGCTGPVTASGADVGGGGVVADGEVTVVVVVIAEGDVAAIIADNDASNRGVKCGGDAGVHDEAVLDGGIESGIADEYCDRTSARDVGSVEDEVPDGAVVTDVAKEGDIVIIGLADGEVTDGVSVAVERATELFAVDANRPDFDAAHVEVVFQSEVLAAVVAALAVRSERHEVVGGLDEPGAVAGSVAVPLRVCRPCCDAEGGDNKDCFCFHRPALLYFIGIAVTRLVVVIRGPAHNPLGLHLHHGCGGSLVKFFTLFFHG